MKIREIFIQKITPLTTKILFCCAVIATIAVSVVIITSLLSYEADVFDLLSWIQGLIFVWGVYIFVKNSENFYFSVKNSYNFYKNCKTKNFIALKNFILGYCAIIVVAGSSIYSMFIRYLSLGIFHLAITVIAGLIGIFLFCTFIHISKKDRTNQPQPQLE